MPDAQWAKRVTMVVLVGLDAATMSDDTGLLVRLVTLMVPVKRDGQVLVYGRSNLSN